MPSKRVEGKTAIITGGAGGIGRATALLFSGEGAAVSVVDLDEQAGGELVREISASGGRAMFERCDVTRDNDCRRVVEHTVEQFGAIHILFNNAGIIRRASILEVSEREWDAVIAVNVKSIFLMSRLVIPIWRRRAGVRLSTLPLAGDLAGGAKAAAYCASKGAVILLTKAMAIDHGAQNIRVNAICPR